jgi:ADP-ribose pyrophosphatase YjhB (NUDIX family)
MKYCSECGAPVETKWFYAEHRERLVCPRCGKVHFENPKVLVTCLAHWDGRLVMCRRGHEPAAGLWVPPGGFVEKGETLEVAAARETEEEAGLIVDPGQLVPYSITTLPHLCEIYISFRVAIRKPELRAGPESLEVGLFDEDEMPWEHVAFAEAPSFYRLFFKELRSGQFSLHLSKADAHARARRAFRIIDPE